LNIFVGNDKGAKYKTSIQTIRKERDNYWLSNGAQSWHRRAAQSLLHARRGRARTSSHAFVLGAAVRATAGLLVQLALSAAFKPIILMVYVDSN
jgi:hypothetical protein